MIDLLLSAEGLGGLRTPPPTTLDHISKVAGGTPPSPMHP